MSEQYKLVYFDLKGRAELIRYIFHCAGVKFEDKRIAKDDWPTLKSTIPGAQLPILEITKPDGSKRILTQTLAIARYLARKFNLIGSNEWEATLCEEIVDTLMDAVVFAATAFYEDDAERKDFVYTKLEKEICPAKMGLVEKRLTANGGKHVVGQSLTWADIACTWIMRGFVDYSRTSAEEMAKMFPALEHLSKSVEAHPPIAAYIAKRPETSVFRVV